MVAVGGVIAALLLTNDAQKTTAPLPIAPTTGSWTPLTIRTPKPQAGGKGIPVSVDPRRARNDFSTTLLPLGTHSYGMTIFNTSNLGAINSLQWYPPPGVRVVNVLDNTEGHCVPAGPAGILCDQLDLKPPSCTCLGDGGSMTVKFVTDKDVAYGEGDLRVRAATLAFDRIPTFQQDSAPAPRRIMRIVTPARATGKSGGLTVQERNEAQSALDGLQKSNISFQLVAISRWLQRVPATCRVRLVSQNPSTYEVYVFWVPWLASNPYVWLDMNFKDDPQNGTFQLGATQPRLPVGGALLSQYGSEQARKGRELMLANAGGAFAKPGAACQVLKNGSLKLRPTGYSAAG